MDYKKCIKSVASEKGTSYFIKGEIYAHTSHSDELWDEEGVAHVIGKEGEEWYDRHFRDITDEEWLKYYSDCYAEMPNHDEIETRKLQESIDKRVKEAVAPYKAFYEYFKDLYGAGLEIANWHMNGDAESFDEFFKLAEGEILDKVVEEGNYKQALEQISKLSEDDKLVDAQYLALVALGKV